MFIEKSVISNYNQPLLAEHQRKFDFIASGIKNTDYILEKLINFQVTIPSWALGTGGTRFGRFPGGGEPRSLKRKDGRYRSAACIESIKWCYIVAYSMGYPSRI